VAGWVALRAQAVLPMLMARALRRGVAVVVLSCFGAIAAPTHPLDPLTADELVTVRDVLAKSGRFSTNTNFAWIQLHEPPKATVNAYSGGSEFPRQANVAAIDYQQRKTFRVIVDLRRRQIASLTDLGSLQPGLTGRDSDLARDVIDRDPRIRDALTARGLNIPGRVSDAVYVQCMPVGDDPSLHGITDRLMRVLFASNQNIGNDASPFVDGLMAVVDLYSQQVVRIQNVARVPNYPLPPDVFNYTVDEAAGATAPALAPGAKRFKIDGNVVTWENWRLRFGFNLREGMVLYQVGFSDQGRVRSILYRASVSEVLTAYGDPDEFWSWLQLFDEGTLGLGYLSVAVQPGRQIPSNAVTVSLPEPTSRKPLFSDTFKDRIYVYERDAGNSVYYDNGGRTIHGRARELVIGFYVSTGNYTYGFNWVFREDGAFAFEAELGGQILTKFAKACVDCAPEQRSGTKNGIRASGQRESAGYGGLVEGGLVGVNHQHWFNLRLDFDIDGTRNAVAENNVDMGGASAPGRGQRPRLAVTRTVFAKAADARRHMNEDASRTWTIYSTASSNRDGRHAGYTLMGAENSASMFPPEREAEPVGFTRHHLWVTPYREGQLYAAGDHPNQAKPDYADVLAAYAGDASIYDTDLVVWYSMGVTHVPRPEDYPVMSNMRLSVAFRPDGFFERNPVLHRH
jgi:primary-amine oxidase